MTPLFTEAPRTQPAAARRLRECKCGDCRDSGLRRLTDTGRNGISPLNLYSALQTGTIALCTCAAGQWWIATLDELCASGIHLCGDLCGKPPADRGVPTTLLRGAEASAWMDRWIATSLEMKAQ